MGKRKNKKITKVSIRQSGFRDGYLEAKNAGNTYITKLIKQGTGKNEIVEMIMEYNIGYKIGVLSRKDLNSIKVRDNIEYYNGKSIRDNINIDKDGILEQVELKKQKKRR